MLEAASTGRWPRTGLDLSSRRWIRRWLRLRRFRRMAFTRNPFLLELMLFGHIHQTPQNTKDFEFFSEFHPSEGETFAWLRARRHVNATILSSLIVRSCSRISGSG